MEVLSKEASKKVDSYTIDKVGIPSIVLMENAAEKISELIKDKGKKFIIICGEGNNGGDGLAIARKLLLYGKDVKVVILKASKEPSKEFSINHNILINIGTEISSISCTTDVDEKFIKDVENSDVVVDAIFGVGLSRNVEGIFYNVIKIINTYSKLIISIDIPSGLDCNTGKPLGIAVRAQETYTIEVMKRGFIEYDSIEFLGDIKIVSIGIPKEVKRQFSENIHILDRDEYRDMIPKREIWGHKGDYGKVLVLAGSKGFTGAAHITVESAIRTGTGLITLLTDDYCQEVLSNKLIEAMTVSIKEEERISQLVKTCDVIACGPGIGLNAQSEKILEKCIKESTCPIILDADALNIVSTNNEIINSIRGRGIITPHVGEMSRLTEYSIDDINKQRIDIAKRYSVTTGVVVLLKGYNTIITDGDNVVINRTGNSKMASGGMGDCLTGIVASLIGQKMDIFKAGVLGSYIHGLAGDRISSSKYSVIARDVIEEIPKIMEEIIRS